MPKSPAFRFYPKDFWGSPDVQTMDLHEVGAYLSLLSNAWASERPGMLPDDPERLRRWSRLTREQWAESGALMLSKFPVIEHGWRGNPRLISEHDKQQAFSAAQSKKGLKGGRPKAGDKPGVLESKPKDSQTKAHEKPSASASASVVVSFTAKNKEQKPSRKRVAKPADDVDPRHTPCRLACEMYAKHKRVTFIWDGSEAAKLSNLLRAAPTLTVQGFQQCLNNRARSPAVTHSDRPRLWLENLISFEISPLNQFKQPEGTGNGTNHSGNAKGDYAQRELLAAHSAIAEKYGLTGPELVGSSGTNVPEPGRSDGSDSFDGIRGGHGRTIRGQ